MSAVPQQPSSYPILFRCQEIIAGNGYLARITASGRARLVREDEDEWWLNGVEPGGFAESGGTSQEVVLQFLRGIRTLIIDFAAECPNYEEFSARTKSFFCEVDRDEAGRWEKAVQEIRSLREIPDPFISGLPREFAARPCQIQVERLDLPPVSYLPEYNSNEKVAIPAAA